VKHFSIRSSVFALFLLMIGLSFLVRTGANLQAAPNQVSTKVSICHRTHSVTNPYRRITVAKSSVIGGGNSKHGSSNGAHNDYSTGRFPSGRPAVNVFSPSYNYSPASDKKWGDIVPDRDVSGNEIQNAFTGLNYSAEGLAIYNGTTLNNVSYAGLCRSLSPSQFVQSEIDSGYYQALYPSKSPSEIEQEVMAELEEQGANEDAALKNALGGSFTGKTLTQFSAISITTNPASAVTSTTATMNGTLTVGSTSTEPSFFWGTTSDCSVGTTVTASPNPVTNTTSVTAPLTGLTLGTTYYYKVIGTTFAGDPDLEGSIEGACVSFTTSAGSSSTTSVVSSTTSVVSSTTSVVSSTTSVVSSTTSVVSSTTSIAPSTTSVVPTSTTSVAPSTTSVAPTSTTVSANDGSGSLRGSVWIDVNRNDVFDAAEPVLPLIAVKITQQGVSSPTTIDRVTDSNGRFSATGLAPGTWKVVATLTANSLVKSYDSDGAGDWQVLVVVSGTQEAIADFAGYGQAEVCVDGTISEIGKIDYTWAGQDNLQESNDDVSFSDRPSVADPCVENLPAGRYALEVFSPDDRRLQAFEVDFEIGLQSLDPKTGNVKPLANRIGAQPTVANLPATGGFLKDVQPIALLMVAMGIAVLYALRRRIVR
jgi:hypothetical protein